jgi:hypothetical protein
MRRPLPWYSVGGLILMLLTETGMLLKAEPFWSWHTPIAWSGYILFVDGLVWKRRGTSWIRSAPAEWLFLTVFSVPLWLMFEFYNLFIDNWHYVNLPEAPALRLLGYGWSFATIWPAIFETGELVSAIRDRRAPSDRTGPPPRLARLELLHRVMIAAGAAMLIWPLVWPSRYLAAPVWLGFIFLLDPLNARAGSESLLGDLRAGRASRLVNLTAAGLLCGLLWEFWNYWARTKWVYTVPILPELKLFEMPLPGYLGFPAFALECFTLYVALRRLVWLGAWRPISI